MLTYLQLAKATIPPIHPSPPTGWTNWPINEYHISNKLTTNFTQSIIHEFYVHYHKLFIFLFLSPLFLFISIMNNKSTCPTIIWDKKLQNNCKKIPQMRLTQLHAALTRIWLFLMKLNEFSFLHGDFSGWF